MKFGRKIVRDVGKERLSVSLDTWVLAVCQVREKVVLAAVSLGVSGAPQVGGAPGAGVHARSSATSSFAGASPCEEKQSGVKNVDTRYVHDDDYPVLLLLGLLRIRSGRLYHLGIISTLTVPVW